MIGWCACHKITKRIEFHTANGTFMTTQVPNNCHPHASDTEVNNRETEYRIQTKFINA